MESVFTNSQVHEYSLIPGGIKIGLDKNQTMSIQEFKTTLNTWGRSKTPFLFWVDFEMEKPVALKVSDISSSDILYDINGVTNASKNLSQKKEIKLHKHPIPFDEYSTKLSKVLYHLNYGDSFLTNLTVKTRIELSAPLRDVFFVSRAKYKLYMANQFLVFSPETFVQMRDGRIYAFPMKGTIDAAVPDAENIILNDVKEMAEHVTIVDLIRNDVSMVANDVKVQRFRYIDKVHTHNSTLLQVSSEITGHLATDWQENIGTILVSLLPAGSICGAPKKKTCEIIFQAEQEKRGYYTGVVGYYNGEQLDSGVMIRYIEQCGNDYYYRSGGGITTQSDAHTEYLEMIDKVYVPID